MLDEIKKLPDWESKSHAEIAAALNAIPRHKRNAYITGGPANTPSINFLHLLTSEFRVLRQDKNQSWVGPLVDVAEQSPDVETIMGLLYPHLQVKDSIVYCGDKDSSGQMVNGLVDAAGAIVEAGGQRTRQDVSDAVAMLTGGRLFADVTAVDVTAAFDAEARLTVLAELRGRSNAAASAAQLAFDADGDEAAITAAWEAAING